MDRDMVISARDRRDGGEGLTLLHEAARLGRTDTVQSLLNMGHLVDCIDSSVTRVTPLMDAIAYSHAETAALLVKSGADIGCQNVRGENCLHYAAKQGSTMIMLLINNSHFAKEVIQDLASTKDIKLRFPEDVSINRIAFQTLTDLRQHGCHQKAVRNIKKQNKS
jgi:ankyrin repeat protein